MTEDVRFNRPAKDGDSYTSEGIYTFEVGNLYTNKHEKKTIYVGSNPYLRVLSTVGMSIAELNAEIEKGTIIHDDGTVEIISNESEPDPEGRQEFTESQNQTLVPEENSKTIPEETQDAAILLITPENPQIIDNKSLVIGRIATVIVAIVFAVGALKRKKKSNQQGGN